MNYVEGPTMTGTNWTRIALRALLAVLLASLVLGCSDATRPGSADSATLHEVLTFPQTITLTTPNSVAPTAPVLGASNSVSLGARAEVVTGLTVAMGSG